MVTYIRERDIGDKAMAKITRIGTMVAGMYCPLMFSGRTKQYKVLVNSKGDLYINWNGKKLHEEDLPMGEEVEV